MPVLNIAAQQVIDLVRQLPRPERGEALRVLLADPQWDSLLAYGEARLDEQLCKRELDRAALRPEQIEQAIEDIAEGR